MKRVPAFRAGLKNAMNMKSYKLIAMMLVCWCVVGAQAQSLKQEGASVDELVPEGWEYIEALGDLDNDGIKDVALIATPDFKEHLTVRDDGYVYNFNQPIVAIYVGTPQGGYRLWKKYDAMLRIRDEYCSIDRTLEITDRHVLRISTEDFCSAGSYGTSQDTYSYRYQNGDFFLIGMEEVSLQRNTGEKETVSENYLTWKRQTIKDNVMEEKSHAKEKWSRLTKKPLEKLGEREL